ncbi:methyltransferase domain-containing protein [Nocardia otitidiscaviarum]|uniref:methyltransferase domain-containing protein n=1 Tax=Nocardia otitidiscaviarum TaxID=1823 RepID=UPI0004A75787|nr:methyltransferase domain-containing protein [Nocardia otitidiscaviarum]MBF6135169.1 methyltransferase domain-containing protein [Nocardia otitidiscaviarum]MBF6486991.1 methyltransferase domain-containing protein [Nocardia otitidiscaviarum]
MIAPIAEMSARRMELCDEHLRAAAADMLRHDARLRDIDVRVEFSGCVAHLTGVVDNTRQLRLVRELVGRIAGVLAVWDRVEVGGRLPRILDVGCGGTKQYPENVGIDIRPGPGVDVVADLRQGIPFEDNSFDRVFAVHVLEHLVDFLPLVDECHRVLRHGGVLHVLSPWWRYVNAVADPTHVRLLDVQTFKGICERATDRVWFPLHAACDGASVFADLECAEPGAAPPSPEHLARFFD